ncbi:MAG: hypothetical protein IPP28_06935 [Xanthomonadales bacterium]|nr:hypothetical protein [Xanthomonadales bacterium]
MTATAVPHRVEAFFRRLGDDIAAMLGESREAVYANLEAVALAKLAEHDPSAHLGHADLVDYVLGADALCKQADLDARFAEPPLSLYNGGHFDISALIWLDGTTSIHQHAFCGAFHVLAGSSIHSRYRFAPWSAPEPMQRAIAGELTLVDIEVLRPGDTRVIRRGDTLIHSLFHMIRPSVTIVVRTITDTPGAEVQYDYRWPGLAHDPFHKHAPTLRKLQYLRMLRVLDADAFQSHLARVLPEADLYLAYTLVSEQIQISADVDEARRLSRLCTRLSSAERELLHRAAHNDLLSRSLIDLRRKLHAPQHRFLLALLLNVFDRAELLRLVQRDTGCADPVAQVCEWISEISGNSERYPNLIGIDFNATALEMLACMWRGAGFDDTLRHLVERHGEDEVSPHREALQGLHCALQQCALFHAVFADLPGNDRKDASTIAKID